MASKRRYRVQTKRPPRPTEASRLLGKARAHARLTFQQMAAALGLHTRTLARWELGETHPSPEQWGKTVAYLARFVPRDAVALAQAAGVPSPIAEPPPVDADAIAQALLRAADLLDVSPRRVREAVREIVRATTAANGKLADLGRAAEESEVR